jgi:predicted metal-dependent HD superfamily phosphohydrolase
LEGTPAARQSEVSWAALRAAYGAEHRAYHTLEHIGEVLTWIDRLAGDAPLPVELAGWLHDVVYDPGASDNEARSADWTRATFGGLLGDDVVEETCRLIVTTETHQPDPADGRACTLADADLAILGAPPARYRRYVDGVRTEYSAFDDRAWAAGRGRVLSELLARSTLYHSSAMVDVERRARQNLASELASLGGPNAHPTETRST